MKNSYFKICLITISLLLLVFSCQDEEIISDLSDESLSIEDARSWFETNNSPIMMLKPTDDIRKGKSKKSIPLQNKWKHAFKSKNDSIEVVEVALRSQYRFGFADQNAIQKFKETKNKDYHNSLSRLVIIKNKKDKSINSYIMTIIGEPAYLEKHNYELWSNTYFEKDEDFAGSVLFHRVNGEFVNGWKLRDGKVYGKISIKDPDIVSKKSCGTYTVTTVYYEQCTEHYNVGENSDGVVFDIYQTGVTCETWSETTTTYNECPSNSDYGGVNDVSVSYPKPHCSSFEYSKPPGALYSGAAVTNVYNTFYYHSWQETREVTVHFDLLYFTMQRSMPNGMAATKTAEAMDRAFSTTENWFQNNPTASTLQVRLHVSAALISEMGKIGGTVSKTNPPFEIPNPAPFKRSLFTTGNCN